MHFGNTYEFGLYLLLFCGILEFFVALDLLLLTSKIESVLSKIKKKLKLLIKKFYFYYYYNCERLYFHSFRPLIRQTKYIYIVLVVWYWRLFLKLSCITMKKYILHWIESSLVFWDHPHDRYIGDPDSEQSVICFVNYSKNLHHHNCRSFRLDWVHHQDCSQASWFLDQGPWPLVQAHWIHI